MVSGLVYRIAVALMLTAPLVAGGACVGHAADAKGCDDLAGLKRFEGSAIALCDRHNFAEYTLPAGPALSYDFTKKRATFTDSLSLEGRLAQNVYAVPLGASSAEVFRNYKMELTDKGFKTLFEAKQADTGPALGSFFENMGPGTQLWGYSPDEARFISAVKEDGEAKTYVALYAVEYQSGYEPKANAQKGQVFVRLDVLQVGTLSDKMVVVSAAEIGRDFASEGKATLYGIVFDFNKAVIKPESRPTLDEVGKLLKDNSDQKIYVIGHTDNVGGFDSNMTLSKARAAAVVADLTRTYGIRPDRLTPSGVGLQAPVAPNTTEEGRAKNRRVELLPR